MFNSFASAASKVGSTVDHTVSAAITFSDDEVKKHLTAFSGFHSPSAAQQYVVIEFEKIKETAPEDVVVDVTPAAGGSSDLKNVALKLSPKNNNTNTTIVVSSSGLDLVSHMRESPSDDSSNVAVMLELARALSNQANGFKHSFVFVYNTGEDEDLADGAHNFMTKNDEKIRLVIDLNGLGIGGDNKATDNKGSGGLKDPLIVLYDDNGDEQQPIKEGLFPAQAKNMKENPITLQDIFKLGIDSAKYEEVGSFSGVNFQEQENDTFSYTDNDTFGTSDWKIESIKTLGENMLPFLIQVGTSTIDFDVSST